MTEVREYDRRANRSMRVDLPYVGRVTGALQRVHEAIRVIDLGAWEEAGRVELVEQRVLLLEALVAPLGELLVALGKLIERPSTAMEVDLHVPVIDGRVSSHMRDREAGIRYILAIAVGDVVDVGSSAVVALVADRDVVEERHIATQRLHGRDEALGSRQQHMRQYRQVELLGVCLLCHTRMDGSTQDCRCQIR